MTDERDDEMVVAWMRQFASLPMEASSLPDPAYLWWKAQLLRRWDAQRTVVAPLEVGERVQVIDLPRAGHFLLLEQPQAVVQTVSAFLGATTAPG